MEQPDSGEYHRHAVTVAGVDHRVVTDGAARLDHILHAASAGAVDVVGEGEESVGAKGYAIQLLQPTPVFPLW